MPEPSLGLVQALFSLLRGADLDVWLTGGWAEELRGLIAPRAHRDIDLLLRAEGFTALDAFLQANPDFAGISAKRFSHKRAALYKAVMVEFILVRGHQTGFFDGRYLFDWPPDTFDNPLPGATGLLVVSAEALSAYRASHAMIESAYGADKNP